MKEQNGVRAGLRFRPFKAGIANKEASRRVATLNQLWGAPFIQPSLRDARLVATIVPALKGRAKLTRRYAAF
jgi:hypothetical protein